MQHKWLLMSIFESTKSKPMNLYIYYHTQQQRSIDQTKQVVYCSKNRNWFWQLRRQFQYIHSFIRSIALLDKRLDSIIFIIGSIFMEEQAQAHGLVVFDAPIVLEEVPQIMARGYNSTITIDWGDYERQGWSLRSSKIKKINAKQLVLRTNRYPNLLKELKHVSFPFLTFINLNHNKIHSLQVLPHFDIPFMKELILDNNYVVSTRSLAKSYFPNLQILRLKQNPLYDNRRTFQAYFPKLKEYTIDTDQNQKYDNHTRGWSDPSTWRVKNAPKLVNQAQVTSRSRQPYGYRRYGHEIASNSQNLNCIKYVEMLRQKPVYYSMQE